MATPITVTVAVTFEIDADTWAEEYGLLNFDGNPVEAWEAIADAREHLTEHTLDMMNNSGLAYLFEDVSVTDTTDTRQASVP